jgi:hypothetical protein
MSKRGPGLKKESPKTITLPLSYVKANESAVDALSMLLYEAPTVENLQTAIDALKRHGDEESKLTREQRDVLDIWQ